MKYTLEINSSIPFDAESFWLKEYEHWVKTTRTYTSIRFSGSEDEIKRLRIRVLNYAQRLKHVVETAKSIDEDHGLILTLTYTGSLWVS